jgi:nickel transport protein
MKALSAFFLVPLLLCTSSGAAFAHRINVFAYLEGDTVHGETFFSGGRPAMKAVIEVFPDEGNDPLFTTATDQDGLFTFLLTEEMGSKQMLRIVAEAGEGHRGQWLLDLTSVQASAMQEQGESTSAPPSSPVHSTAAPSPPAMVDEQAIGAIVEKVVEAKLAPLRRDLAAATQCGPSLSEILGGLGYIIGLAGLAAYLKSQKKGGNQ